MQKTTLVTEDMLVEAVTARVTDDIKRDMDERFGSFERALERITAPNPHGQPLAQVNQAPPKQKDPISADTVSVPPSQPVVGVTVHPAQALNEENNPQLAPAPIETPLAQARRPSRVAINQPEALSASAHDVNKNNNNHTWTAWSAAQQRPEHIYSAQSRPFAAEMKAPYDSGHDAQVRHILEATPHNLKGNLPHDFP